MQVTFRGKLLSKRDDFYSTYIFQNLDEPENSLLHYVSTVRPPNWTAPIPQIDDVGFITCEYVNAGEQYYQRNTGNVETYKYTTCYFLNFIKEQEKETLKEYKF